MSTVRGEQTPWGYGLDNHAFADGIPWTRWRKDGWTAIGRRDNTVDSRPGSHSTFAFHADLTIDEAEAKARYLFPEIFARTGWTE
jgi:hypothetical protein